MENLSNEEIKERVVNYLEEEFEKQKRLSGLGRKYTITMFAKKCGEVSQGMMSRYMERGNNFVPGKEARGKIALGLGSIQIYKVMGIHKEDPELLEDAQRLISEWPNFTKRKRRKIMQAAFGADETDEGGALQIA